MFQKFFKTLFAESGDKTSIPDALQPTGDVSYTDGFGFDYQRDLSTDPAAKAFPRNQFNSLMYEITKALQQYQTFGFPEYITSADNGGTAYAYAKGAVVRYTADAGVTWSVKRSLIDGNTNLPSVATAWEDFGATHDFIVRAASSAATNLAAPGATIGGVTMAAGNRFLEKDHATGALRGIYIWNGAAVAATRAPEADDGAELKSGSLIVVTEGTYAGQIWGLNTANPIVIDTTALSFSRKSTVFASNAEITAGTVTDKSVSPAGLLAAFLGAGGTSANDYITIPYRDRTTGVRREFILQWGVVTGLSANTDYTFTFPIAFPNASLFGSLILNQSAAVGQTSIATGLGAGAKTSYVYRVNSSTPPGGAILLVGGW